MQQKAEDIESLLKDLPEPLDRNLAVSVMGELIQFQRKLEMNIDSVAKVNHFQKQWNLTVAKFCHDLAETRPVLLFSMPHTPQNGVSPGSSRGSYGTPTPKARQTVSIQIDSDDSDVEIPAYLTSNSKIGQKRPQASASTTPNKFQKTHTESKFTTDSKSTFSSKRFSLSQIQDMLQEAYTGLNSLTDPRAIETMISMSMDHWEVPLQQFLARTRELCEGMVADQVQDVYGKYFQTQYYESIREICESFFDAVFAEQNTLAKRLLTWEQAKPKTCNDEAITVAQAKASNLLQTKRREMRAMAYLDDQEGRNGKLSNGQARMEKVSKITDTQMGPDPFKKEIEAMTVSLIDP